MSNPIKPIAVALSQWNSQTEILYACPRCGQDFRILGQNEQYCHKCGQKIDWSVITKGNQNLQRLYFDENNMFPLHKQRRLMDEINYLNNKIPLNNEPCELMDYFEFSCADDICSTAMPKDILGSKIMIGEDNLPFNCIDCVNQECAYAGKKCCVFCSHFKPV